MFKEKIYLDTSIISAYYDERIPYQKDKTRAWWDREKLANEFDLCLSQVTITELKRVKDDGLRQRFMDFVEGVTVLDYTIELEEIAGNYLLKGILREKAIADAYHVAYASWHKIDYLLTWNIADLACPNRRKKLRLTNGLLNIWTPEIITPEFFEA